MFCIFDGPVYIDFGQKWSSEERVKGVIFLHLQGMEVKIFFGGEDELVMKFN